MKAQHTPGPWRISDERSGLYILFPDGSGFPLPTITDSADPRGEQARANAVLIAAAPDLLAALKAFMWGDGHDDFEDEWPAARAAIVKAEGRTP